MREKKKCCIISFNTTAEAMEMEYVCDINNIQGRLIPLPREISAGCGLAWKMDISLYYENKQRIDDLGIKYNNIYELMI